MSQCPAGLGHQGEDIRPGSCLLRSPDADRCEPYQHNIVAVRDGLVLRDPGRPGALLVVNAPGEHIRFRYLHMDPQLLDAAGMVSGRALAAGEVIGAVDNYEESPGRHQLSPAFRRAGADARGLAFRQSLHDAGRGL